MGKDSNEKKRGFFNASLKWSSIVAYEEKWYAYAPKAITGYEGKKKDDQHDI